MPEDAVPVNLTLRPDLLARLDEAALREDLPREEIVRQAIARYLDDLEYEALVDEGLALAVNQAMADPASSETTPLEEFLRERNL